MIPMQLGPMSRMPGGADLVHERRLERPPPLADFLESCADDDQRLHAFAMQSSTHLQHARRGDDDNGEVHGAWNIADRRVGAASGEALHAGMDRDERSGEPGFAKVAEDLPIRCVPAPGSRR